MVRGSGNRVSTSISLDADLKEALDDMPVNRSELANQFFREYVYGSDGRLDGLKFREKMLEQEIEQLEKQLEEKCSQLEQVREEREERGSNGDEELREAFETLEQIAETRGAVKVDNPALENWAGKLGMRPKDLLERFRQQRDGPQEPLASAN